MTDIKLKPCPFCGGEAEITSFPNQTGKTGFTGHTGKTGDRQIHGYYVRCIQCSAQVPADANGYAWAQLWNTRHADTRSARAIIEKLGWKELSEEEQEINKCENLDALERYKGGR